MKCKQIISMSISNNVEWGGLMVIGSSFLFGIIDQRPDPIFSLAFLILGIYISMFPITDASIKTKRLSALLNQQK